MEVLLLQEINKIKEILVLAGCAQISDAASAIKDFTGGFALPSIKAVTNNSKFCGPVFSVNTDNDMLPGLQALHTMPPGYVIVINNVNCHSEALAGDIFVTDCINAQCNGLVINGAVRDIEFINRLNFPVFAKEVNFISAKTARVSSSSVPEPVMISDYLIEPNDWMVGDEDGLYVIKERFLNALLFGLQMVQEREEKLKVELSKGARLGEICGLDAFLRGVAPLKFEV